MVKNEIYYILLIRQRMPIVMPIAAAGEEEQAEPSVSIPVPPAPAPGQPDDVVADGMLIILVDLWLR